MLSHFDTRASAFGLRHVTSQIENRTSAFELRADHFRIRNSTFALCDVLRSLFFWDRNTDAARRAQHEETGSLLSPFNEACRTRSIAC